ncbi:MAG: chemotaxis protein CheW [Burkholderiaceae bacterium]
MSEFMAATAGVAAAPTEERSATAGSRLGIAIGDQRWLIDLRLAGEVLPIPEAIAIVPGARPWFKGLANLRGALHGVVDLAEFQGGAPTERGKDARLLAFSPRLPVNAAILVSRMMGLQSMARMQQADSGGVDDWCGPGWRDAKGALWRELDLERLCANDAFLSAGR